MNQMDFNYNNQIGMKNHLTEVSEDNSKVKRISYFERLFDLGKIFFILTSLPFTATFHFFYNGDCLDHINLRRADFSALYNEFYYGVRKIKLMNSISVKSLKPIGKDVDFNSWDITITGEDRTMYFGPFGYNSERINPADLMRYLESGKYNAKVTIMEKSGKTSEENIGFKLYKSRELKNASRYLMIFDYNKSDAVLAYETKIRKEIAPGIIAGNKVIVHGHTDNIGNEAGNQQLSQDRANQAKSILDNELTLEGKQVDVRAVAIGQTQSQYSFANRYPEGRMYNRNVFVEIIE